MRTLRLLVETESHRHETVMGLVSPRGLFMGSWAIGSNYWLFADWFHLEWWDRLLTGGKKRQWLSSWPLCHL